MAKHTPTHAIASKVAGSRHDVGPTVYAHPSSGIQTIAVLSTAAPPRRPALQPQDQEKNCNRQATNNYRKSDKRGEARQMLGRIARSTKSGHQAEAHSQKSAGNEEVHAALPEHSSRWRL